MRRIFLDDLPKRGSMAKQINWKESIGKSVKFIYGDIEGEIQIIDYLGKSNDLYIQYSNNLVFKIHTGNFANCMLGKLLNKITTDFKLETGTIFKDDNRDITIIGMEYRISNNGQKRKYYKYKCNKCGNKGWIIESNLIGKNGGCNACGNGYKKVALGINTIWDIDRWMCDLGVSEEDAKTHTKSSNDKIKVVCPDCGKEKTMRIYNMYRTRSIACTCSDKISYPNKFAYSLLDQLNEIYGFDYLEHEYSPDWIKPKRYDNYFIHNGKEYILEMDGKWHKEYNYLSGQTAEQSKVIDDYKDRLAKEHNIDVVRVDCDYQFSNSFKTIKQNIIDSILGELFNLSKIDWLRCEEFALSNLVKQACDYWNSGIHKTKGIAKIMKLSKNTIISYLKKGSLIEWCNYNAKEESNKISSKNGKANGRQVEMFKDGISLGVFSSCSELERKSEELFKIKLSQSKVSLVAIGKQAHHKGFTFKYINEIEQAI